MATKGKSEFNELDNIKDDLESLKSNVIELARHLQGNGASKTMEIAQRFRDGLSGLQNQSRAQLERAETLIRAKPAQSLVTAFVAGLVISVLMRRK